MQRSAFLSNRNWYSFILIFLCFTLTSGGWISWNYHLIGMMPPVHVDLVCMVAGYALQAAGIALFVYAGSKIRFTPVLFTGVIVLYILFLIPATMSTFVSAVLVFGLLDNLLCGFLAALYLHLLAYDTDKQRRGLVFGGGYAASTIAVWLLSLIGESSFLGSSYVLIVYVLLAVLTAAWIFLGWKPEGIMMEKAGGNGSGNEAEAGKALRNLVLLGGAAIILLSIVKNIGFSFPTSDIVSGLNLELSRVFYGSGLLIAGFINDKARKYGAICTLSALILPFISLALSGQPVPLMVFWSLDYFFYGFFSVFRVLFFADLAEEAKDMRIAGMGLLTGRIGDVLGTLLCILLADHPIFLILAASVLFILTVIVFFHLYMKVYVKTEKDAPSEKDRFDRFAASCQLSAREKEVFRLLLADQSNSEIAAALFVSESTVKFHIHNMLQKTGCKNRSELKAAYHAWQS